MISILLYKIKIIGETMKKSVIILLTIFVILVTFSSCDLMTSIFGSSEAAITAFTEAGIIGEPEIDVENATITLTVEPMDLSTFDPEITISESAVLTEPESISDGVAATYTVTAENGDIVEWSVTVTVQYGVSFLVDGTKVVLTSGFEDSTDATTNAIVGNGVPGIDADSGYSYSYTLEEVYDLGTSMSEPAFDYFAMDIDGDTTGTYNNGDAYLMFYDYSVGSSTEYIADMVVTEFGAVDGVFRATYTGTDGASSSITNGFAKLLVVEEYPM